ncbi:MAG: NDP-sugar synthase [Fimbriimonadales bacterium]|nr:NDP-sugar synthase [Fimbriimonadales bacterium]
MRGVIIAGGFGTRLRPLTLRRPKPLIPVANRAFLEYQVAQLKAAGADEIVFATNYLAERIEAHFGDGSRFGVRMRYAIETEPLGTAGAIRNAVEGLPADRAVVFNGDILTDFDIGAIVRQHLENHAQVTLTLYRVRRPHPYGVIRVSETGRVQAFLEPTEEQKRAADRGEPMEGSDFINAGIYVMEPETLARIPLRPCSIEREFYPQILAEGAPVYGVEGRGFWLDIGRPAQYLRATRALLSGEVKTVLPPIGYRTAQGYWLGAEAEIEPDAEIEAGCHIGDNVRIEARVQLIGYTVVGAGSSVGGGSVLHGCILGERVQIGDGCHLVDCIIDDECLIEPHVRLRNAVLGAGSVIRAYSAVE